MGRIFTPGARFAGILRLNFLDEFRGKRLARKDVRDDVWTCEIVSFGGGCWNGRIREGMEEPFHTERAQSARVAFMAAAPSMILGLECEAVEEYYKICRCYGQDILG